MLFDYFMVFIGFVNGVVFCHVITIIYQKVRFIERRENNHD